MFRKNTIDKASKEMARKARNESAWIKQIDGRMADPAIERAAGRRRRAQKEDASREQPVAAASFLMSSARIEKLINRLVGVIVPLGIGVSVVSSSMYNVQAGHRGVIFDRYSGVRKETIPEGTHFLVPWLQKPIIFDVRTQPRNISTTTGSKDMQRVSLTLRVLHRPLIDRLSEIYSKLGLDYAERVLPSIGNEVLKAVVAQFDASELITQRELVSQRIREELIKRSNEFNILLEDVSITHLTFGKEFTNAVEQKQVAQQEAERAKYIVEKAEQEKAAAIIRAEGESHAAALISKAMHKSGNGLIELRRIEAAKDIASTLAASKHVTYLPSGDNQQYLLDVSGAQASRR